MESPTAFLGAHVYFSIPDSTQHFQLDLTTKLEDYVQSGGGHVVHTPEEATHIVIWHMEQPDADHLASFSNCHLCSFVWFFACIEANTLLPTTHSLYIPFPKASLYSNAEQERGENNRVLRVSVTGFVRARRLMVQILLTCIGVSFQKQLHLADGDRDDVLVAEDLRENSQKLNAARGHEIPTVTLQWILDSLSQQAILPTESYTTPTEPISLVFIDIKDAATSHADVISDSEDERQATTAQPPQHNNNGATKLESSLLFNTNIQRHSSGAAATASIGGNTQAMGIVGNLVAQLNATEVQMGSGPEDIFHQAGPRPLPLLETAFVANNNTVNNNTTNNTTYHSVEQHPTGNVNNVTTVEKAPAVVEATMEVAVGVNEQVENGDDPTPTPSQLELEDRQETGAILDDELDDEVGGGAIVLPQTEAIPFADLPSDDDEEEKGHGEEEHRDTEELGEDAVVDGPGDIAIDTIEGKKEDQVASAIPNKKKQPAEPKKPAKEKQKMLEEQVEGDADDEKDRGISTAATDGGQGVRKSSRRQAAEQNVAAAPPPPEKNEATTQPKQKRKVTATKAEKPTAAAATKKARTSTAQAAEKHEQQGPKPRGRATAPPPASTTTSTGKKSAAASKSTNPNPKVHLALSGLHREEQQELVALAKELNVKCTAGTHSWQSGFTHIVAPELKRNQKCLAALASGAWLVAPSFLKASKSAGKLVSEAKHELKSGSAGNIEQDVAAHWRTRAVKTGHGAFEGLTFALTRNLDEPPTKDDICAIIKAGGGLIVPLTQGADVVVASSTSAINSTAVQQRVKDGSLCVTSMYIVDWLAKPNAKLDGHVLLNSRKGSQQAAVVAAHQRSSASKSKPVGKRKSSKPVSPAVSDKSMSL